MSVIVVRIVTLKPPSTLALTEVKDAVKQLYETISYLAT